VLRAGELPGLDPSRESRWLQSLAREGRTGPLDDEIRVAIASDLRDRERFLEALCHALFDLTRAAPDAQWLLETPARIAGFPAPAEAELVFAELPGRKVGYWHDAGHAARLAALGVFPAEEWLARLGRFAGGVTVADWSTSASELPPGAGVVDWTSLTAQLTAAMPRVLRLHPSFPAPLLDDALREAESLGL